MSFETLEWRKASRSRGRSRCCVEVAETGRGRVAVRDSKLGSASPVLVVPTASFSALLGRLRRP